MMIVGDNQIPFAINIILYKNRLVMIVNMYKHYIMTGDKGNI